MTNIKNIGSVPVSIAAKVYGKDPTWIRAGIIAGWLPIGIATRGGKEIKDISEISSRKGKITYYISPKLLYEATGYQYVDSRKEKHLCQTFLKKTDLMN